MVTTANFLNYFFTHFTIEGILYSLFIWLIKAPPPNDSSIFLRRYRGSFEARRGKGKFLHRRDGGYLHRDLMQQTPSQLRVFITKLHLTVQGI